MTNKKQCRFKFFPISIFSILFGFLGLTIAVEKLEQILKLNNTFSNSLLLFSILILLLFLNFYIFKIFVYGGEVKKEGNHPVKLSFFPALSVSFLLSSIATLSFNEQLSKMFLIIGAILQIVFTIKIVSMGIQHEKFELKHLNPAGFIPILGNVLVPISAVHFGWIELSGFYFSIGFGFGIIIMVIFFNRIIFHRQMAQRFIPTLFILISPPFIAFIALTKLMGEVNIFGKNLYFLGLFLFLVLLSQGRSFAKVKFFLSSWAYSFPIASMTIATVLMYHGTKILFYKYLAIVFFGILVMVILGLIGNTIFAIKRREICEDEEH